MMKKGRDIFQQKQLKKVFNDVQRNIELWQKKHSLSSLYLVTFKKWLLKTRGPIPKKPSSPWICLAVVVVAAVASGGPKRSSSQNFFLKKSNKENGSCSHSSCCFDAKKCLISTDMLRNHIYSLPDFFDSFFFGNKTQLTWNCWRIKFAQTQMWKDREKCGQRMLKMSDKNMKSVFCFLRVLSIVLLGGKEKCVSHFHGCKWISKLFLTDCQCTYIPKDPLSCHRGYITYPPAMYLH